jgi:hypothetical protein
MLCCSQGTIIVSSNSNAKHILRFDCLGYDRHITSDFTSYKTNQRKLQAAVESINRELNIKTRKVVQISIL